MAYNRKTSRVTGYFSNESIGLYLPFQFNPQEITRERVTNYEDLSIPGLDELNTTWVSGGGHTISFDLAFDARGVGAGVINSGTGLTNVTLDGLPYVPTVGCLPHLAILESFLVPIDVGRSARGRAYNMLGSLRGDLEKLASRNSIKYTSPPRCTFHYGARVYETVMKTAPILEKIHNSLGVPVRFSTTVTLLVISESNFNLVEELNRVSRSVSFSSGNIGMGSLNVLG